MKVRSVLWSLLFTSTLLFSALAVPEELQTYEYEFHNVLLDNFATKSFQLALSCKGLLSDSRRAGRLQVNLKCERKPFQIKIIAPTPISCKIPEASEYLRIYLNVRSHFLKEQEIIDISDPLTDVKKRLTSASNSTTIDGGLQSHAQLLTTGPLAMVQYTPGSYSSAGCTGRERSSLFFEMEFVLVSEGAPSHLEAFYFHKCEPLNGYIPTGVLCDQWSELRPIGCPLNVETGTSSLSPAIGQDRRGLNCYPVVLQGNADPNLLGILDGSMVVLSAGYGIQMHQILVLLSPLLWLTNF